MITRQQLKALVACVGIIVLAIGTLFLVQHMSEEPEAHVLTQDASPAGLGQGKVVLSLSSAMVMLVAGPPGSIVQDG